MKPNTFEVIRTETGSPWQVSPTRAAAEKWKEIFEETWGPRKDDQGRNFTFEVREVGEENPTLTELPTYPRG